MMHVHVHVWACLVHVHVHVHYMVMVMCMFMCMAQALGSALARAAANEISQRKDEAVTLAAASRKLTRRSSFERQKAAHQPVPHADVTVDVTEESGKSSRKSIGRFSMRRGSSEPSSSNLAV